MTGWTPKQIEAAAKAVCEAEGFSWDRLVDADSMPRTSEPPTRSECRKTASAVLSALPFPSAARDKALEEQRRTDAAFYSMYKDGPWMLEDLPKAAQEAISRLTEPSKSSPPAPASASSPGASPERDEMPAVGSLWWHDEIIVRVYAIADRYIKWSSIEGSCYGESTLGAFVSPFFVPVTPPTADLASMRKVVEAVREELDRVAERFELGDLIGDALRNLEARLALASLKTAEWQVVMAIADAPSR